MAANKRILVVDDEPHIRQVLELKLTGAGYDVKAAADADAGLEAAKAHRPDLIVSDYKMPGHSTGVDLIYAVRQTAGISDTPIILLTGSVAVLNHLKDLLGNLNGVLMMSKPFSPRNLLKEVQHALGDFAEAER